MTLPVQTIGRLLRENFSGETPILVQLEERKRLGERILQRIRRLDSVDPDSRQYLSQEEQERLVCTFTLRDPEERYYDYNRNDFRLSIGDAGELVLEYAYGNEKATVANLEELDEFLLACHQRLQRRKALAAKRTKVRELKSHAVVARVKKLARELQFDFMTEMDTQKLKLFVRLSDEHAVRLDIPFSKFEQMLPHLRTTILSLRELYDTGIRFKLVTRAQWGWRPRWISYKEG